MLGVEGDDGAGTCFRAGVWKQSTEVRKKKERKKKKKKQITEGLRSLREDVILSSMRSCERVNGQVNDVM